MTMPHLLTSHPLLVRTGAKLWASLCRKFWLLMFTAVQQIVVGPAGKMSFIPLLVVALQGTEFPKFSGVTAD